MSDNRAPSISAVVAAYQAEDFVAEAIDSILGQTRPPDEVVVVDDGSTDRTADTLSTYGDQIRVLRQENAGYPGAMNRAIREARGDYVALCGADDIWEPRKLEWQAEALAEHPEAAVLFGHAIFFGHVVGDHARPHASGLLDGQALCQDLFLTCTINTPSAVIRRDLFEQVGWFTDRFLADDYEFYFRCVRAGLPFFYDPRTLVRYRRHENNITNDGHEMRRAWTEVRLANADLVGDPKLVRAVLGPELFRIARRFVDEGRRREAREAFRQSLRYARGNVAGANARALTWLAILMLPVNVSNRVGEFLVSVTRALDGVRGGRNPALP
jgi:glycosyltransferase involved in cell wall biosynthesis